jgi:hypothetical protein
MGKIAIASALALIGCANNVPQDRSTGPDGKVKGAKPIEMENGEGKSEGIVTYPGGDRVDWKLVELPEGKKGQLDLSMKWQTPRPGLQLGFDVFDQWGHDVSNAKGSKSKGRVRSARVPEAKGKYFVRVYAKGRGDAGAYKLYVAFKEDAVVKPVDLGDIPEPPRLPAVPGPTCPTFDAKDPDCRSVCPMPDGFGAPPNWKACVDMKIYPPGSTLPPPPPPPPVPPPPPPPPIKARVIGVKVQGDAVIVTISAGSSQKVDKSWSARVLRGDTKEPMIGAHVEIFRVDEKMTFARVTGLTVDLVNANPFIVLQAPAQ